jgi:hypothetical protein
MFPILKSVGILFNDRRVICRQYEEQLAMLNCISNVEEVEVKKGIGQGCAFSLMIFNYYVEKCINETKEKLKTGLQVHAKISMLRFGDGGC